MANTDDTSKNSNDEDNFGLPDIEYKPLDELDTSKPAEETVKTEEETSRVHQFSQETFTKETTTVEEEEEVFSESELPSERAPFFWWL